MELKENVAYLKGLVDGMGTENTDPTTIKALKTISDILFTMSEEIKHLDDDIEIICDELDAIDEDLDDVEDCLEELEEDIINIEEDIDLIYDGDFEDCLDGDCCNGDHHNELDELDDITGSIYDITCPSCGDQICIDDSILDMGSIDCPNCSEELTFDIELDNANNALNDEEIIEETN